MTEPRLVPKIDFHAHFLEQEVLRRAAGKTVVSGFGAKTHAGPQAVNPATIERMFSPDRQIEDMDRRGVDINVVSSATVIQGTSWADPKTDLALCERCNDRAAEWVAKYPKRFIGSFTLPLQDIAFGLGELERSVKQLGLRVANLCTQYQGAYIGDPRYEPFWAAASELGTVIWIYPDGARDPWYQQFGMWNSLGQRDGSDDGAEVAGMGE